MPKLDDDLYATLRSGGVRKRVARAAAKAAAKRGQADLRAVAADLRGALAELDKRSGLAAGTGAQGSTADAGPRGAAAELAAGTHRRSDEGLAPDPGPRGAAAQLAAGTHRRSESES